MNTKRSQSLKKEMLKQDNRKVPLFLRGSTGLAKKQLLEVYKENLVSDKQNLRYNEGKAKKIIFVMTRMSLIYMVCALLLFAGVSFSLGMAYAMWVLKNDQTIVITKRALITKTEDKPEKPPSPATNTPFEETQSIEKLISAGNFPKADLVIKQAVIMNKKSFNNDKELIKKEREKLYNTLHIKNKAKDTNGPYSLFLASSQDPQEIKKLITKLKMADYNTFYQNNNGLYELYIGIFPDRNSADLLRRYLLSINIVAKTTFVEQ